MVRNVSVAARLVEQLGDIGMLPGESDLCESVVDRQGSFAQDASTDFLPRGCVSVHGRMRENQKQ